MTDDTLKGKVAVITGAGRGFGLAFARAFAEQGATSVIGDVDSARAEQAAAGLKASGLKADFLVFDVSDAVAVDAAAQSVAHQYGSLDLWVNNAGIARHGASETLPAQMWQLCLNIMLSGTFYGAQAAGRIMIEQRSGHIINIASVNGFVAQAGRAAYCSAKAGVIRLTEVLAAEWAEHHIRVNAIAPAVFLTDLARDSLADGSASMDVYLDRSPTGRLGEIEELVQTMLFLASERSSYITGQTLRVDGAWVSDHSL